MACSRDDGKKRFLDTVAALSKAFALASTHDDARKVRDEVGFFQTVRTAINKVSGNAVEIRNADFAIRQIVSEAIASTEVIDIFAAVGLKRPDISLLSEEFLTEIRRMPQRNLAVELLSKLVRDEIKASSGTIARGSFLRPDAQGGHNQRVVPLRRLRPSSLGPIAKDMRSDR